MLEALLSVDQTVYAFATVFALVLIFTIVIVVAGASRFGPRAKFKKRLASVAGRHVRASDRPVQEGSRRKDIQDKLRQFEEGQKAKRRRRNQIRQEIQQAGLAITVRQYTIGSIALGVVGLAIVLLLGFNIIVALLAAVAFGLGIPKFALNYKRGRRLKAFTRLFPEAIDIIVRGVQSGLPVGECLNIIARESPDPIGEEFKHVVESLQIGLTLEEALARAQDRIPTQELRFFAIVLQIQAQTGGNLAETLNNLSTVLRDRKKMRDKVSAMASEANASAAIIGSLPFIVCGMLVLVNPSYLGILFTDTTGQVLVAIGLAWMSLGVFIMRQMINFEI